MPDSIETIIIDQAIRLTEHEGFKSWSAGQQFKSGGLVMVNNSFVFRDVKTNKAEDFITLRIDDKGNYTFPPVVSSGLKINSDFKYLTPTSTLPAIRLLGDALVDQKQHLGELVFVLIGEIKDDLLEIAEVTHSDFDEICWDPKLNNAVKIYPRSMEVGQVHDEDVIWECLMKYFADAGVSVPDGLRQAVGTALDKLQEKAAAHLMLPEAGHSIEESITDKIVTVLKEQMKNYDIALSRVVESPDDMSARNDILRLAYNFASDATGYLKLIVSVCDLKPMVLWGTLFHHYSLAEAFRLLPWTRSHNKPSMKGYVETISDARNSAFHNLFPFKKSLNITLTGSSLAGAELRIFSEHGKKKENVLSYRDKPLVDVLTEFTRARERQVTTRFWKQNFNVMEKTVELFEATTIFIKELHSTRKLS
ncbi:MAG: hypothetical protein WD688_23330 [Candidatus Binatia bacterium]